jgi:hypothetical protein
MRGEATIEGGIQVWVARRSSFLGHPTRSTSAPPAHGSCRTYAKRQNAFRTGPWTALKNAPPTGSTGLIITIFERRK